ncbi:unnamed protein product [Calypogeia fissa]
MITRRNLAEQLRDYQLRSERDWSSLSFWASVNRADASTSNRSGKFMVLVLLLMAAGYEFILQYCRRVRNEGADIVVNRHL